VSAFRTGAFRYLPWHGRVDFVQIDILAEVPDGGRIVVECRHHDWNPGMGLIPRTINRMLRAQLFFAAGKAMLFMASLLPAAILLRDR
jgi:hypothetical protein